MRLKCAMAASLVLLTTNFSMAMDNREVGSEKGDFKVMLRERTASEMAEESDKTQKYILVVGEDELLDKEYLLQLKSCSEEAVEAASDKAAVRKKLLALFDSQGPLSSVMDTLQSLACNTFNAEREKKEVGKTVYLSTPNFEGLNTFIGEHLANCIDNSLNKAHWTKVEGGGGFKIPNSYSVDTIKKYCPKEGS